MRKYLMYYFLSFSLIHVCYCDVLINELAAATSDRNLKYSTNGTPTVGSGVSWTKLQFDDSLWNSAPGSLGFGYDDVTTDLRYEMRGIADSLYIRQKFVVSASDAAKTNALKLLIEYNDGFTAYINGKEVARENLGPFNAFTYYDQSAYNIHTSRIPADILLSPASDLLTEGTNVISIQVHNIYINNSKFLISPDLFISDSTDIPLVNHSNSWNYFVGVCEPSGGVPDPGLLNPEPLFVIWGEENFDDSSWKEAPGGFGYGDENTTTVDIQNIAYSLYIRQSFVADSATTNPLVFTVGYDDGFIAYLNGYEIARRKMGTLGEFFAHNQPATGSHEVGTPEIITLSSASDLLVNGINVLAIETHNVSIGSSDMSIVADLKIGGASEIELVNHTNDWRYFIGITEPSEIPAEIDGDFVDWLELYNNGAAPVSLKGWSLTDDESSPDKWIFPDVSINAGEYLVVYCDGRDLSYSSNKIFHTNFKLSDDGEYLGLFNANVPRHAVSEFSPSFPQQSFFYSYGRNQLSNSYLYYSVPTPGKQNSGDTSNGIVTKPIIDRNPGFYEVNVNVSITSAMQTAEIRYTTDGSEPTENSALYSGTLTFDTNTVLRAKAFKAGWIPSKSVTRTYLLNQPEAIKNVPIVSLVGDPGKTLFKSNGVTAIVGGNWDNGGRWEPETPDDFNIPKQRGRPYERPGSVEFLYYDTNLWTQTDCGIRIAGSTWTRAYYQLQDLSGRWDEGPIIDKPQFNLFFRGDYGESILDFPLMPGSRVTEFDSIRLRSGKNDWKNPFITDEFVRRMGIATGQVNVRGYLAWVFINGELKAYFNPVEKYDEKFFQEWYNSNKDWDIINQDGLEEGDESAWDFLCDYFDSEDLNVLSNYILAAKMLDMVNYIDYLIVETYGANKDWPNNNWVAARERSDNGIFRFYIWDAEASFYAWGNDVDTDSFNRDDGKALNSNGCEIATMYRALKHNTEFKLLFSDRIQKHYFNDGCMMVPNLTNLWNELGVIMQPMCNYFFGDSFNELVLTNWIPERQPYVFDQFRNEGLWPDISAPYFNQHGGSVTSGFSVVISQTNSSGNIYFTTDGTDPRNIGGSVHGTEYSVPLSLRKTTQVKARVYNSVSSEWSPLCETVFSVTGVHSVVVTEIMYDPLGGKEFEYIELQNISGTDLDISDVSFVDGITFAFAGSMVTNLQKDDFVVVVKSISDFASRYDTNNILIAGEFDGKLRNSGERIELQNTIGESLLAFTYQDYWYPETDGEGYSLVIVNALANTNMWDKKEGWRPSYKKGGSPGRKMKIADVFLYNLNQIYSGTGIIPASTTFPSGLSVTYSYNGEITAPVNVGEYSITAIVDDVNYYGITNGILNIEKSAQTILSFMPTNGSVINSDQVVILNATASSGLQADYTLISGPAILYNDDTLRFTGAGAVDVCASQSGSTNWLPSLPVTNTYTITDDTPVHYVALNGQTSYSPYSTWETAATNFNDVLVIADGGDLIIVSNGTYYLSSQLDIETNLTIKSLNGAEVTIIDGKNSFRCFNLYNYYTKIEGLKIQNGYSENGDGGAVLCDGNNPEILNCIIIGNAILNGYGGGIARGTVNNCLVYSNAAKNAGGIFNSVINNCTVVDNSSEYGGGTYSCSIYNSIIWNNSASIASNNSYNCEIIYSCSLPLPTGEGNISNNPEFAEHLSPDNGGFMLQLNSPCINSASNAFAPMPVDLAGNPRIINGTVDMGCYEFFVHPFINITNYPDVIEYTETTAEISGTNVNVDGLLGWTSDRNPIITNYFPQGFMVMIDTLSVGENNIAVFGTNSYLQSTNSVVCIRRKTAIESAPQIATNALLFPSSGSILAPDMTNIYWDFGRITDDVDGTDLIITKISVYDMDTTNELAAITNNVSNLLGQIPWVVPVELISVDTEYALRFEAVDSNSLTNGRIFFGNEFAIIPESGYLFIVGTLQICLFFRFLVKSNKV